MPGISRGACGAPCSLPSCPLWWNHWQGTVTGAVILYLQAYHCPCHFSFAELTFLNILCLNVLSRAPKPTQRESWLYNMLYIFKTCRYSLWKDKYMVKYKVIQQVKIRYRKYLIWLHYYYLCFENTYKGPILHVMYTAVYYMIVKYLIYIIILQDGYKGFRGTYTIYYIQCCHVA